MNKVAEIASAIKQLSEFELSDFRKWYSDFDNFSWDRQIEKDRRLLDC